MADQPPTPGPSGSSTTPKAIASLAKKQSDVTRLGTQKLKFVPTLPARRKKEEVKKEGAPPAAPAPAERGRGRGGERGRGERGRGRGRGGEGRGAGPRAPPVVEMTASGPFAMGPTLAGTSARRTAPRSNFAPIVPQGPGGTAHLGAGLTLTTAPSLKRERGREPAPADDDVEAYSDPDEGVEIVDMDHIKQMDWMAPESLGKEKEGGKRKKGLKVKADPDKQEDRKGKGVAKEEAIEVDITPEPQEEVNLANAVDLSDSEEEEELEDIIDDFAFANEAEEDTNIRQERLYFFQFPSPFPTFISNAPPPADPEPPLLDKADDNSKKVTFAQDTKPPAPVPGAVPPVGATNAQTKVEKEEPKIDGIIGQLEIYESGAVKMRLGNGIVMDVTAATQPSFLQQAIYLDNENKRLCVLGEVNRRFAVSPNVDTLLSALELAENPAESLELGEGLITMDTS